MYTDDSWNKLWFEKTYFECDCMSHNISFFHDLDTNEIFLEVSFESYDNFFNRFLKTTSYILFKKQIIFNDIWILNRWQSTIFMEYLKAKNKICVSTIPETSSIYIPKKDEFLHCLEINDRDEYILTVTPDYEFGLLTLNLKLNGKKTLLDRIKRGWNYLFSHELRESKYGRNIPFNLTPIELSCIIIILSELIEIDNAQLDLPNFNAQD